MQRAVLRKHKDYTRPGVFQNGDDARRRGNYRGRRPGSQNKTSRILKEAILLAAEQIGEDGRGSRGLLGYLRKVARQDMKSFCVLLGKVLPLQITAGDGDTVRTIPEGMSPAQAGQVYAETIRALSAIGPIKSMAAPPPKELTSK